MNVGQKSPRQDVGDSQARRHQREAHHRKSAINRVRRLNATPQEEQGCPQGT